MVQVDTYNTGTQTPPLPEPPKAKTVEPLPRPPPPPPQVEQPVDPRPVPPLKQEPLPSFKQEPQAPPKRPVRQIDAPKIDFNVAFPPALQEPYSWKPFNPDEQKEDKPKEVEPEKPFEDQYKFKGTGERLRPDFD